MVWDNDLDLTQPLRAILKDAASMFPADVSVLIQVRAEDYNSNPHHHPAHMVEQYLVPGARLPQCCACPLLTRAAPEDILRRAGLCGKRLLVPPIRPRVGDAP